MQDNVKLENHLSLDMVLAKLRHVLTATQATDAIELLEKAVNKTDENNRYFQEMEDTLLRGSTVELREWLSAFGDYMEHPRTEFPWYPHHDAVNGIDSAMGAIKHDQIKPGAMQEMIDFVNF